MPAYILLMRYGARGFREARDDPATLHEVDRALTRWEARVLESYCMLGEWDQCTIVEAPDDFRVYRASLAAELGAIAELEILPAIDYALFSRLAMQEGGTEGPHPWQIRGWAKLARLGFRWHAYGRWVHRYCKPLTVTGREKFRSLTGPCIVVANHTSHMDALVLNAALPQRIRWNIYSGAAADRWFVKGRPELVMQPWYQSLAMGTFPIQRGGGSRALEYPRFLLDNGCNLLIFPEGTRSSSRGMAKFRHGVSILALEKNVPVVPVFLSGLAEMRPKGSREIHPGPAGAQILDPIRFEPGTAVPEATRRLYDVMNEVHLRMAGQRGAADPSGGLTGSVALSQPSRS